MTDRIDSVTAWVITEANGDEGIAGFQSRPGIWLPMVGADHARIESLRPVAMMVAKATNLPLRLVRFSTREILEEHLPEGQA